MRKDIALVVLVFALHPPGKLAGHDPIPTIE
jgi:hypothetical protein